ncbi:hypothetical protein [Clostridium sardiniense]|uniref:hypothetical protein n=1 Tax=Clostridium sardiniense TaxID=29369 RepID=UPI00195C5B3F|nr:hypothetical protein [Clostridium sardiniense]MBM7835757.1 hypothetical protein [Clostridium sardiniense]
MVKLHDGREVFGIIYRIKNKINNKVYIGQTTQARGFKDRYCCRGEGIERVKEYYETHQWKNKHLCNSFNKYGMNNFEVIEELDTANSMSELNEKEEKYINFYNSVDPSYGYNNAQGGCNKERNKESKIRFYKKVAHPIYCITTKECFYSSVEASERYNLDNKKLQGGMKRYKKYSIETKQGSVLCFRYLFGQTECKSRKPIIEINSMKIFYSLKEATLYYGLHKSTITRQLQGNLKKRLIHNNKQLIFIYAKDFFNKQNPTYDKNVKTENNVA